MNDKPKTKRANYAFIDGQNLNMGIRAVGWRLDFRKFRAYLHSKYNVEKAYFFIGEVSDQEDLYANLKSMGYDLVFKPTVEVEDEPVKGNVDADLVLHAMMQYPHYGKAVIVSGDGDFHGLIEYLIKKDKLLALMVPNWRYSSLLKKFEDKIIRIDKLKKILAWKIPPKRPEPSEGHESEAPEK
ncbi:MAG: NYN domain-containing protein [Candidatus Saccharimonadales bacterium]